MLVPRAGRGGRHARGPGRGSGAARSGRRRRRGHGARAIVVSRTAGSVARGRSAWATVRSRRPRREEAGEGKRWSSVPKTTTDARISTRIDGVTRLVLTHCGGWIPARASSSGGRMSSDTARNDRFLVLCDLCSTAVGVAARRSTAARPPRDISLRCRRRNQYEAELVFGTGGVSHVREARRPRLRARPRTARSGRAREADRRACGCRSPRSGRCPLVERDPTVAS